VQLEDLGIIPNYYDRGGCAVDIRAAEVPKDYEIKALKADREFNGAEYV